MAGMKSFVASWSSCRSASMTCCRRSSRYVEPHCCAAAAASASSAGNHGASAALQNARMQSSRRVEIRNNVFHTLNAHRKNIKLAYHYYLSRSMSRPHLRPSMPPLASLHAPSCEPRQTLGPPGLRGCSPPRTSRLRMPRRASMHQVQDVEA